MRHFFFFLFFHAFCDDSKKFVWMSHWVLHCIAKRHEKPVFRLTEIIQETLESNGSNHWFCSDYKIRVVHLEISTLWLSSFILNGFLDRSEWFYANVFETGYIISNWYCVNSINFELDSLDSASLVSRVWNHSPQGCQKEFLMQAGSSIFFMSLYSAFSYWEGHLKAFSYFKVVWKNLNLFLCTAEIIYEAMEQMF